MILREEDGVLKIETEDGWVVYEPDTTVPDFVDAAWLAKGRQQTINSESLAYLASTDWYITRQSETDVAVPQDILTLRAAARVAVVTGA
tara:strand:+ start:937 stop:1203 length:267 start_codon:yes stop_codon:yes gene_type:complete